MRSSVSMRSHTMASASSMTAISRRMISFSLMILRVIDYAADLRLRCVLRMGWQNTTTPSCR